MVRISAIGSGIRGLLALAIALGLLIAPIGFASSHGFEAAAASVALDHDDHSHGHTHDEDDTRDLSHGHDHNPGDHSHETPAAPPSIGHWHPQTVRGWTASASPGVVLSAQFPFERPPRPIFAV